MGSSNQTHVLPLVMYFAIWGFSLPSRPPYTLKAWLTLKAWNEAWLGNLEAQYGTHSSTSKVTDLMLTTVQYCWSAEDWGSMWETGSLDIEWHILGSCQISCCKPHCCPIYIIHWDVAWTHALYPRFWSHLYICVQSSERVQFIEYLVCRGLLFTVWKDYCCRLLHWDCVKLKW